MEVDRTSRKTDSDIFGKEINGYFYCDKYVMDVLFKFSFLPTKRLGGLNK